MKPAPFEFETDDLPWLLRALRRQARTYRAGSADEADVLLSQTFETGVAELGNRPPHCPPTTGFWASCIAATTDIEVTVRP